MALRQAGLRLTFQRFGFGAPKGNLNTEFMQNMMLSMKRTPWEEERAPHRDSGAGCCSDLLGFSFPEIRCS